MRRAWITIVIAIAAAIALCIPQFAFADGVLDSNDEVSEVAIDEFAELEAVYDDCADEPLGDPDQEEPAEHEYDDSDASELVETPTVEYPSADTTVIDGVVTGEQEESEGIEEASSDSFECESPKELILQEEMVAVDNDDTNVPAASVVAAPRKAAAATTDTPVSITDSNTTSKPKAPKIKSGWYTVKSLLNTQYALFVKGLGTKDGTKIQLRKGVVSAGYAFKFKKIGNYYRVFVGIAKGKSVQVVGVKNGSGGIVSIGSKANKKTLFTLKYDATLNGWKLVNVATKQALSVKGGKAKNGANVRGAREKAGAKAQTFILAARPGVVTTGIYSIKSIQKGKRALSVDGKKGAFKKYGASLTQKWYIAPVAGKQNTYTIESIATGKRLTGNANKRVKVLKANAADKTQWWVPSFGGKGIVWKNVATKKPLSTVGETCDEGSKAVNKKQKNEKSREFTLAKRIPVESGVYELKSAANVEVELGVKDASKKANAAVRVTETGGEASQKWIYNAKTHTLENVFSGKLLDSRTSEAGSKLVQADQSSSKTQRWSFTYVGGGKFQLVSDANKKLVVSATAATDGSDTTISANGKAKTQTWRLAQSGYLVEPKGFNLIEDFVNWGHGTLNASYIVIHETANPGASAWNHRMLWSGDNYYSDYAVHYVLDWTGNCYYCVPEDRLCWQVGYGNPYVIGIELCHATNASDFMKVWNAGVQWAAWQLKKHDWGISRLLSHNECGYIWGGTDHTDPDDYFESFGKSWKEFKSAVKKALANY